MPETNNSGGCVFACNRQQRVLCVTVKQTTAEVVRFLKQTTAEVVCLPETDNSGGCVLAHRGDRVNIGGSPR